MMDFPRKTEVRNLKKPKDDKFKRRKGFCRFVERSVTLEVCRVIVKTD